MSESEFKLSPEEMKRVEDESREQIRLMGQPINSKRPSETDEDTEEPEE